MFGNNPIRKPEPEPSDGKLAVQDVFYTIQGEGPFAGRPAVFIRLAGCHLACTFCDTEFETGINNRMSVDEIMDAVHFSRLLMIRPRQKRGPLVVLTGGEPFRQNTLPLVSKLVAEGFHVQYETAGNLSVGPISTFLEQGRASLVVSPKTPQVHDSVVKNTWHWKYVVNAVYGVAEDGLPIGPTQAHHTPTTRVFRPWDKFMLWPCNTTIWLSPMDAHDAEATKRNQDLAVATCMKYGYRLSLQTHKILGLP